MNTYLNFRDSERGDAADLLETVVFSGGWSWQPWAGWGGDA